MVRIGWPGTPLNPKEAFRLYNEIINTQGISAAYITNAKLNLAEIYKEGWPGTPPNPDEALKLLNEVLNTQRLNSNLIREDRAKIQMV